MLLLFLVVVIILYKLVFLRINRFVVVLFLFSFIYLFSLLMRCVVISHLEYIMISFLAFNNILCVIVVCMCVWYDGVRMKWSLLNHRYRLHAFSWCPVPLMLM